MKTRLLLWFRTEGDTRSSEVVDRLMGMGFKPVRGYYDFVYNWSKASTVDDVVRLADQVHEVLRGCNVLYKLETI